MLLVLKENAFWLDVHFYITIPIYADVNVTENMKI